MSIATPAFSVCCEAPAAAAPRAVAAEPHVAPAGKTPDFEASRPEAATQVTHEVGSGGKLRAEGLPIVERNCAIAMHLSPFSFLWIGPIAMAIPLIIWVAHRNRTPFYDDHGREVTNFMISFILLHLILGVTVVGLVLWPVLWIVSVVSLIRGAVAASRHEFFRYPVTIRFLK